MTATATIMIIYNFEKQTTKRKTIIPWMKIVRSVPVWAAFMSYFLYYSAKIGTLVYLPLYLSEAVGLTVSEVCNINN